MAHFHLAWELGGDPVHAGRLRTLAQALTARRHAVSLSVRDLGHTRTLLGDLAVPVLQAPLWLHSSAPHAASLAEVLLAAGYRDATGLDGLLIGWRSTLELLRPDLVVADYAPSAILAARTLDVPALAIGSGFTLPPAEQPLPHLRPWEAPDHARLAAAEQHVLRVLNAVLVHRGGVPYRHAADVLLGQQSLLCTWPELDHYGRAPEHAQWVGPLLPARTGEAPHWPAGQGHKVFVYLRQEHPAHAAVLHALVLEGCRVLCYQPEVAAGGVPPVHASNLQYARGPVDLAAAMAEARLCVCQGGEGTVVHALRAGVPLLLLPTQLERYLQAERLAAVGAALNGGRLNPAADWRSVVRSLLMDARYLVAVRGLAARHAAFSPARMLQAVLAKLEAAAAAR